MSDYSDDMSSLPSVGKVFIKSKDFKGGKEVTFLGVRKIEPGEFEGEPILLRYSDNPYMYYKTKKPVLDDNGNQVANPMYDPAWPKGYSLEIAFAEGVFTCSSLPAYKVIRAVEPKRGDVLQITRTGDGSDAKWECKKIGKATVDFEEPAQKSDRPF
jgi:hypothetical protein